MDEAMREKERRRGAKNINTGEEKIGGEKEERR